MKSNSIQTIIRKLGAIVVLSTLAISATLCAPSQQPLAASQQPASKSASTTIAPKATQTATGSTGRLLSSAASETSGSPSLVQLRPMAKGAPRAESSGEQNEQMDAFDGKNPFADDSLWQIPVHLVRDQSAVERGSESMAKSASETSAASDDDDDDEGMAGKAEANLPQSSASSPTIISASTDLKAAAGYHYPSHGHHGYGHGSDASHHGAHYGGADHHYGKYFQYASVPHPGAWEFGYRRGNPYHTIERHEHGKGPHFQTKVKWSDKHGGYGVHVWDYNHDDHYSHHYGGHDDSHAPSGYGSHEGGQHGHYGHH